MIRKKILLFFCCTFAVVFVLFGEENRWIFGGRDNGEREKQTVRDTRDDSSTREGNTVQMDSFLIYKAYYDTRMKPPRFRIIFNAQCTNESAILIVNGTELTTTIEAAEGDCPWKWAPACEWNAFTMESQPFLGTVPDTIQISRFNRSVSVPIEIIQSKYPYGLTVCVPPLYWFSDWLRLIVFFELWKLQGASRFIMWRHSVSKNVLKVLNYYATEGVLDVRPWPDMSRSSSVDPNLSTYRLTHSLAHLDCSFRASTRFATLNDIDEFLVTSNGTLLQYLQRKIGGKTNYKAALFEHSELKIDPPYIPYNQERGKFNLEGLRRARVIKHKGPPKTAFMPQFTKSIQTHQLREFFNSSDKVLKIPHEEGLLLHGRNNFGSFPDEIKFKLTFFADKKLNSTDKIRAKIYQIFNGTVPLHTESTNKAIGICLGGWRKKQCKTPISSCNSTIFPLEEWVFAEANGNSRYWVL